MAIKRSRVSVFVKVVLFLAFVIGIGACIALIAGSNLTNRESALLGLLVTILSILASWIITHMYSESQHKNAIDEIQEQHRANLRTYALKAAEKVNNLSNELNKLSLYLEQELNYTDYGSTEEELQAKEERIESAIHLIQTLKSVNDTSLSDWEGVIGEELDQQREEREEKEEELKSVIERVESLIEDQRQGFLGSQRNTESLRSEIDHLQHDLQLALSQLSGITLPKRPTRRRQPKQIIEGKCPACSAIVVYRQRPVARSVKSLVCKQCGNKLMSRYGDGKEFNLQIRGVETVKFKCTRCGNEGEIPLDTFPGSAGVALCNTCNNTIRVVRTLDGIEVKAVLSLESTFQETVGKPSEEVLSFVKAKLPPQPWPTGIHKVVAKELGVPSSVVSRAIKVLIQRGECYPQIEGKVFLPSTGGSGLQKDL